MRGRCQWREHQQQSLLQALSISILSDRGCVAGDNGRRNVLQSSQIRGAMRPDDIKNLILREYPEMCASPRRPDGWSIFYREINKGPNSTRIATVIRSSDTASTRFRPVVSKRLKQHHGGDIRLDGGSAEVRQLFEHELRLFRRHFSK